MIFTDLITLVILNRGLKKDFGRIYKALENGSSNEDIYFYSTILDFNSFKIIPWKEKRKDNHLNSIITFFPVFDWKGWKIIDKQF